MRKNQQSVFYMANMVHTHPHTIKKSAQGEESMEKRAIEYDGEEKRRQLFGREYWVKNLEPKLTKEEKEKIRLEIENFLKEINAYSKKEKR